MAKPRIVIAETEELILNSFQAKFAEDFFEKVDLELISNEDYFDTLFSTPQKIDVLVVSEYLYDSSLHRHDIGDIYLLTEETWSEERTSALNVEYINKYTSIKEIFGIITSKSGHVFNMNAVHKNEPQIVVVYSACGGAGKTTVSLGLCANLVKNYKKVLYMNADYLQSFQTLLENDSPIAASDAYARLSNPTENIYQDIKHVIRKEKFSYLPPFKASLLSLGIKYHVFEKIALGARKSSDFDYIIVDADSAFDEDKANLIDLADKVVIVTNQNRNAVYSTKMLLSNINNVNSEKYIFVCNNFKKDENNELENVFNSKSKIESCEYVYHIPKYDHLKIEDFAMQDGIKNVSIHII